MFNNKVVIVTGGTSGIGEAVAKSFDENGAIVVIIGRNSEKGLKITNEINNKYSLEISYFLQCDISIEENVRTMVYSVIEKFGHIDILFNNSGIMLPSKEIERLPSAEWKETFDINLNGMFYVTKYAKEYLVKSKGVIINNASIAGLQYYSAGRSYAYSASKAAVIQFSHQMAKNYACDGLRVNCICPGIIDTPILGDRDRKVYAERIPLGYVGKPDDVAKVVLFLASENASYLTGVVLPVDGGVSL